MVQVVLGGDVNFCMSWDVTGSGLEMFWDGFENMLDVVEKYEFSKRAGSIFPEFGDSKKMFSGSPAAHIEMLKVASLLSFSQGSFFSPGSLADSFFLGSDSLKPPWDPGRYGNNQTLPV